MRSPSSGRPLLVLRPEPGASSTARAIEALGRQAIIAPMFEVVPVAWDAPDPAGFDALILTSANAVRHGGAQLSALLTMPVYAVGAATAGAACAAGFTVAAQGDGDAGDLLARAAGAGMTRLLHLAGREHRAIERAGINVETRIVYASDAVTALPGAARLATAAGGIALLHSPRAATLFAELAADAGLDRGGIAVAALSAQVASAAGDGWAALAVAHRPTDDALLAAALRLCDQ